MKRVYVGNLDFSATEESIRSLFEPYGAVERVDLIRDRQTGQSRGFAFVEMTSDQEADRAIAALNGSSLGGRQLTINEARPRVERPGFGPGGGGGGGGRHRGGRRPPRW